MNNEGDDYIWRCPGQTQMADEGRSVLVASDGKFVSGGICSKFVPEDTDVRPYRDGNQSPHA
jgi:hypothetical protein